MRRQSKKTRAVYLEWGPVRQAFLDEHPRCALPDCPRASQAVHEITSGSARMAGFVERATWLGVCYICNCERLTDAVKWPKARQLAAKMLQDPEGFDLEKFHAAYGRPMTAVPADEVLEYLRRFLVEERL